MTLLCGWRRYGGSPSFSRPGLLLLCHTDLGVRGVLWTLLSHFPWGRALGQRAVSLGQRMQGRLLCSTWPAEGGPSCLILHDLSRDRAPGNPCSLTSSPSFLLLQVHPAFPGWGRDTISPALATLTSTRMAPLDTQEGGSHPAHWHS